MADESHRKPSRWLGRLLLAMVAVGMLWAINVSPGWRSWSVLTTAFADVVTPLNLALAALAATQIGHALSDRRAVLGFGEATAATLTLVVLARLFVIFPFSLPEGGVTWVVRGLLALCMVGVFVRLVGAFGIVARRLHVRSHLRRRRP